MVSKLIGELGAILIGMPRGRNRNVHESIVAAVTSGVDKKRRGSRGEGERPPRVERGGRAIIISPGGRKEGAPETSLGSTRHFGVFSLFRGSRVRRGMPPLCENTGGERDWNRSTLTFERVLAAFRSPQLAFVKAKETRRGFHSREMRRYRKVWFNDIDLRLRWRLSLLKTLRLERYREPGGWKRGWIRIWSASRGYFVRFERTIGIRERGKLG